MLALLGGTFRPVAGLVTAVALGGAAGLGEELLFRGVLQYELIHRFHSSDVVALGVSGVIFGALHAVTPLYALLAAIASVYFGWLYLLTDNLAVPIVTHAFYDLIALLSAHYDVAGMTTEEQRSLARWTGPMDPKREDVV
jgi:membrane protease YdiL (CAAX protease family)